MIGFYLAISDLSQERLWQRIIQVAGLVGFMHEVFIQEGERLHILLACLAAMGLKYVRDFDKEKNSV